MTLHRLRTHPQHVEGCFACKVSSISLSVPHSFKADQISAYSELKQDIIQAVRDDKEGRIEKAR